MMTHTLFQIFSYSMWAALYLSVTVLIGQIMEWVSTRYPVPRKEPALARLEARYEEARRIIVEQAVKEEASRIIAQLDDQDTAFMLDADFEYRRAADGGRAA